MMRPDPHQAPLGYMDCSQGRADVYHRLMLLDWLIAVVEEFEFHTHTIFLTANYLDRFLAAHPGVAHVRLQLVAATALFLAAKMEEHTIWVIEIVTAADGAFTGEELVQMEMLMANTLSFELNVSTPHGYLHWYAQHCTDTTPLMLLQAEHCLETYVAAPGFTRFPYSVMAMGALFLGRLLQGHTQPWSTLMQGMIGCAYPDLKDCVDDMHTMYLQPLRGHQARRSCYSSLKNDAPCHQVAAASPA